MTQIDSELLKSLENKTYTDTSLNLSSKQLTDEDITLLYPLLEKNPQIIELDLSYNKLTNKSATRLAKNTTLRTLYLKAGNKEITITGLQDFLNNDTLTKLPIVGGSGTPLKQLRSHIKNNSEKSNIVIPQTPIANVTPAISHSTLVSKIEPSIPDVSLITDPLLFPRSEYYTRFAGTTAFAMNEPDYWGSYHRSESTRFFNIGRRKHTQFLSPFIEEGKQSGNRDHSFFSHTGAYRSPFSISPYYKVPNLIQLADESDVNLRDRLLLYKNKMAKTVVESFEKLQNNQQKKIKNRKSIIRPIVYTESDYPCVLVALPVLNKTENPTKFAKYWSEHPKPFQQLLLSSFIAFLNVEAMQNNIPIEMVLRASFGHNLPSVCETNNTFRINVGVIPKCYAELIGKALYKLNQAISNARDETSQPAPFSSAFLAQVKTYNVSKLIKAICSKKCYDHLKNTPHFNNANEEFERLYKEFREINKNLKKGYARFVPVELSNQTVWSAIRQKGNCRGDSILMECFRKNGTADWFANAVMKALLTGSENPIEIALAELLSCLSYKERVKMNNEKIKHELKCPKLKLAQPSFELIYKNDTNFTNIIDLLCKAFSIERPLQALYAELERAGAKLITNCRGSHTVQQAADYGSSSEFSDEFTDETSIKRVHFSHAKLRVCTGMKAILLAQYGALYYFKSNEAGAYAQEIEQMYYEVEEAIHLVRIETLTLNKVRAQQHRILHFDLNHCNTANLSDNTTLQQKLQGFKPKVVILDCSSSTSLVIKKSLQECFSNANVDIAMLIESGLKNSQGGLDTNPYGEIRVCGRNRGTVKKLLKNMQDKLSEEDKLSQTSHEIVRVCKRRGIGLSLYSLFKTNKTRFQAVLEENQASPLLEFNK